MKTTCPKCGAHYDVPDCEVIKAAASISSKRRKKHGGPTADQAKKAGEKGARKRWGDSQE